MIADMVAPYSFPVAFNVPIGHVQHNVPIIEGAQVTLKVSREQGDMPTSSTGLNELKHNNSASGIHLSRMPLALLLL